MKTNRITKDRVIDQWESIYAESVLKMEKEGIFMSELVS